MTKEELKVWFWNKFNNCYIVKHEDYPQCYFMIYDEKYLRYKKFARITGNKIEPPNISEGVCIFEQDYKNGYFWCDYDTTLLFFRENYSNNYTGVKELIDDWLKETNKLSALTPAAGNFVEWKETNKLSALTTSVGGGLSDGALKETSKLSALTTQIQLNALSTQLKETEKLSALTTNINKK